MSAVPAKPPVVEFKDVSVRFGRMTALHEVSIAVEDRPQAGEFVSLVGPSGCGKSTLMNLLAGFLRPTLGQVLVDGRPVDRPGSDRGFIFQRYSSLPHLTVLDNVAFGLSLDAAGMKPSRSERRERAMEMVRQVGLEAHALKFPHQLSGGQQQRVAIARSLILEPRILLMDEPFSALDEPTRLEMQELVVQLWHRRQATIFCISHSIAEAVYLGERVWIFSPAPGQIAYDIRDAIPPSLGVSPLEAQERPDFKEAVRHITELFRRTCQPGPDRKEI